MADNKSHFDVVVVGAGFSGLYLLNRLRALGFSVKVFEAGKGVGGTWYWNRYPGARCDIPSVEYSFSFDKDLQQEWTWSEKYATQPEILKYLNHVADRYDLRKDIQLETYVKSAVFDESKNEWDIKTDKGDVTAKFFIMATGCLTSWQLPTLKGLENFKGKWYHTANWPEEGVDVTGKRVAVIGTGSSGIQAIPMLANTAEHLTVLQRTPNFAIPARNAPLDPKYIEEIKANYDQLRQAARGGIFGLFDPGNTVPAAGQSVEDRTKGFEVAWQKGGLNFYTCFIDLIFNKETNDAAVEFLQGKIKEIVKDPAVADLLAPKGYPVGTKRICVATDYFETFNRPNVKLVDLHATPLEEATENGLRVGGTEIPADVIVFATGFDAMTGALTRIDIKGRGGQTLKDKWAVTGPHTYLGLAVAGFPNFFTITGPLSPSVLSNMVLSIEQHANFICDALAHMKKNGLNTIEPTKEGEDSWVAHANTVANMTLFTQATNSWYVGANTPGKPRVFMPYIGGVGNYRSKCDDVAAKGYEGFALKA